MEYWKTITLAAVKKSVGYKTKNKRYIVAIANFKSVFKYALHKFKNILSKYTNLIYVEAQF